MALSVEGLTPLLQVFDLPLSIAFYRDVLGFEVVSGDDTWWCMLKLGSATLMLNTAYDTGERPDRAEVGRVLGHGDTALYFGADPDEAYALLKSKGWQAKAPVETSYGYRVASAKDPDGFELCFLQPSRRGS